MSKAATKGLLQELERAGGRAKSAPLAPERTPPTMPPSRAGKVHVGAYLDPGFKTSLLLLRARTGWDTQTAISKALNEVFRAHDVPVVGHD
jgi:hypothetical protein